MDMGNLLPKKENTSENFNLINNKVMELKYTLINQFIQVILKMICKMDKENLNVKNISIQDHFKKIKLWEKESWKSMANSLKTIGIKRK